MICCAVLAVHLTSLPIDTKNFLTFCFTAPLVPLAYLISRFIKVDLIMALAVGCLFPPYILAVCMVIVEVLFSIVLIFENRKIKKTAYAASST